MVSVLVCRPPGLAAHKPGRDLKSMQPSQDQYGNSTAKVCLFKRLPAIRAVPDKILVNG